MIIFTFLTQSLLTLCLALVCRLELIRNPKWKTYAENGQVPAEGDAVYVRYNVDGKWYRGSVDEVKQVTDSLVLILIIWSVAKVYNYIST